MTIYKVREFNKQEIAQEKTKYYFGEGEFAYFTNLSSALQYVIERINEKEVEYGEKTKSNFEADSCLFLNSENEPNKEILEFFAKSKDDTAIEVYVIHDTEKNTPVYSIVITKLTVYND